MVERPASVIKELIENSLDAGASRIDIEVDKGGHKRILIRDDGCGIPEAELKLALSRHATSKISSLDDLERILSLGFRGEALASISAVARLTISSKPAAQAQGWQARAEGRDMDVSMAPVAHPDGTSVEVLDLFFNTPARRKFLRTEKTEFTHIDEVVRRIALSRFDVAFSLRHNGKMLRQYPRATHAQAQAKRVGLVCGNNIMTSMLNVQSEMESLHLTGWLCTDAQPTNDTQYFYVNGRMMRDKLINHAIRQAFEDWLPTDTHPAFVLYLKLDASEVDVNVHPAKHEVRFHQSRLVHDFIYQALRDMLVQVGTQEGAGHPQVTPATANEPRHNYIQPLQPRITEQPRSYATARSAERRPSAVAVNAYQHLLSQEQHNTAPEIPCMLVQQRYLLSEWQERCWLVAVHKLQRHKLLTKLQSDIQQPLLMPVSLGVDKTMQLQYQTLAESLQTLGLDLQLVRDKLILRQVPAGLRHLNWSAILPQLLICEESELSHTLVNAAAPPHQDYDRAQAYALWHWFVGLEEWQQQLRQMGQALPQNWLENYAN